MSKPIWTTPAGHLGTIQENEYYNLPVIATAGSSDIVYTLVAGKLPGGLLVRRDGVIEGQPTTKIDIAGIPQEVGQDVKSTFAIRATADEIVTDRTFTLTVTGQDAPVFTTSAGTIGTYIDGSEVDLQLTAHDPDPDDTYTFELISGDLPPGITMNSAGKLTGFITPTRIAGSPDAGYDQTFYDQYGYDFTDNYITKAYQFTVSLTDGKDISIRQFAIDVKATVSLRADSDPLLASNSIMTADAMVLHRPVIKNTQTTFYKVLQDNKWFLQVLGHDYDETEITYSISSGPDNLTTFDSGTTTLDVTNPSVTSNTRILGDLNTLPPGLTLNSTTGWITGNLPAITEFLKIYNFWVRVSKKDNKDYYSEQKFTIYLVTDSETVPTWSSPAILGTVISGEPSRLYVEAVSKQAETFSYRVGAGTTSGLPQGLTLQTDGTITGVTSFSSYLNDNATTTYDEGTTTWDGSTKVTIQAINSAGDVRAEKEFTINVKNENYKPYENVYLVNQAPKAERDIWDSIIHNKDNIASDMIYRPSDPNFGLQHESRMLLAHGLNPKLSADYMKILQKNFYKLELNHGEIKTAQAIDPDTNKVVYEVVYVEIADRNTERNTDNEMVPGNVAVTANLATTINNYSAPLTVDEITKSNTNLITSDVKNKTKLYPSGIEIMRKVLIDGIGQLDSRVLPLWMRSAQKDGKVLGYVPAVVLCYAKPTKAAQIKYYLDTENTATKQLSGTSFTVDRLLWDNSRSKNYNKTTGKWSTTAETTFDSDTTTFEGAYTSFFGNVDTLETSWNTGDKYLKFPRETIMDTPN